MDRHACVSYGVRKSKVRTTVRIHVLTDQDAMHYRCGGPGGRYRLPAPALEILKARYTVGIEFALLPPVLQGFEARSVPGRAYKTQGRRSLHATTRAPDLDLELDDEEEIIIVHREALRHSITRLGAILQDIEEELRQGGQNEVSEVEHPLRDKEVKELMGRLFRLLGRVSRPIEI